MTIEERLESHFPTPVLIREHGALADLTPALCSLIEEASRSEGNMASTALNTTQGGFQSGSEQAGSEPAFLDRDHPALQKLKGEIIWPAIESYLVQVLNCDPLLTPLTISSWAVSLGAGDWQAPHFHPKEYTVLSGVYYVAVPNSVEPEGFLEFIHPNLNAVSIGNQSASRRHQPRTGQLILFPPYYMHYVHPLRSSEKRHVIAFDVRLKQR